MAELAPRIRVTDSPGYLTAEETADDGYGLSKREGKDSALFAPVTLMKSGEELKREREHSANFLGIQAARNAQNGRTSPTKSRPSTALTSRSGQSNSNGLPDDKGESMAAIDPLSQVRFATYPLSGISPTVRCVHIS